MLNSSGSSALHSTLRQQINRALVTGDIPKNVPRALLVELALREDARQCQESLAHFVQQAWPYLTPQRPLQWNWHIDVICAYLEAFARRDIRRLIISVPPRCMKSSLISVFFPVWVWLTEPGHQFLTVSHEAGLALRDAVDSRKIIDSPWFHVRWPKIELSGDRNEKGYYGNTANGHRNARGILSGITGRGGDSILCDDLHDAEKAQSDVERQNVLDAFDGKLTSRLNDQSTGGICIIGQRLHQLDIIGHVLAKKGQDWTHLVIPMEYDGQHYDAGKDIGRPKLNDPRKTLGELLWPVRFPRADIEYLRIDLGNYGFSGQMQQRPSPAGGGILKKHWWKPWPKKKPLPICDHIFESWDTAFSSEDLKNAAYSARTEWGVWWDEQSDRYSLILLDAWDGRVEYPELRREAKRIEAEKQPDRQLIEKKASGISLIQDMRRAGISVWPYTPDRDKISRAYAVQAMLESGQVWYPEGAKWAERVIDMVAVFPNGAPPSADLTDTCTQALLYLRNGWWTSAHPDDIDDTDDTPSPRTERPQLFSSRK
jgi:predicted phage terminase large subunit-like protein